MPEPQLSQAQLDRMVDACYQLLVKIGTLSFDMTQEAARMHYVKKQAGLLVNNTVAKADWKYVFQRIGDLGQKRGVAIRSGSGISAVYIYKQELIKMKSVSTLTDEAEMDLAARIVVYVQANYRHPNPLTRDEVLNAVYNQVGYAINLSDLTGKQTLSAVMNRVYNKSTGIIHQGKLMYVGNKAHRRDYRGRAVSKVSPMSKSKRRDPKVKSAITLPLQASPVSLILVATGNYMLRLIAPGVELKLREVQIDVIEDNK